ncbi:hypothetical protein ILYODFUR_006182 [Ilyodon furcidens]|uniref:Uncharacterized protein n=1 Tax=Ilyodon furcidens TaxID=33524 RepID=A0ABV0V2S8_9TELE
MGGGRMREREWSGVKKKKVTESTSPPCDVARCGPSVRRSLVPSQLSSVHLTCRLSKQREKRVRVGLLLRIPGVFFFLSLYYSTPLVSSQI